MSDGYVTRPQAPTRKIHSKDEFELCYLRHQYFRKTDYNPTEEEMYPYMFVVKNLSKNTYYTYQNLLSMVGLDLDDVINIGRVHLTSYLGLFSVASSEERKEKFKNTFYSMKKYPPTEVEILCKDRADLTAFLKQRFEDLIRVCRQKGRNIKGHCVEEYFAYKGPNKPPKVLRDLIETHDRYGFKKIDQAAFRTVRKRARPESNVFEYEGMWYVAVPNTEQRNLGIEDFAGAGLSPYDNVHNMTPEEILVDRRGENVSLSLKEQFDGFSREMKINKIKTFIKSNFRKRALAAEIATARKLLKALEA
jgi:hypothetical protein